MVVCVSVSVSVYMQLCESMNASEYARMCAGTKGLMPNVCMDVCVQMQDYKHKKNLQRIKT